MTHVVTAGLDLLSSGERHADRLALACSERLADRSGGGLTITTHPAVLGEHRHVALVLEATGLEEATMQAVLTAIADEADDRSGVLVGGSFVGDPGLEPVLRGLLADHARHSSGRAAVFPGQEQVPATTTVGELLSQTAVGRVQVLGGAEPAVEAVVLTRGFLRPRWVDGELVLHVQPASGGVLLPFETPDPTPCCAAHAG